MKKKTEKILMVAAAAMLLCLAPNCGDAESGADIKPQVTELMTTSQSWDGVDLPNYPEGKPQIKAIKVVIPPHCSLAKHHHDVMSFGYIIKGELTLVRCSDGKETTVHAGEAVTETVSTTHYGENRGDETTELVVFYNTKDGQPISEQD